jgi:phosphatidate cytidylyltransferase
LKVAAGYERLPLAGPEQSFVMIIRVISGLIAAALWIVACFAGLLPFTAGLTAVVVIALWELLAAYGNVEKGSDGSSGVRIACNSAIAYCGALFPVCAYLVVTQRPASADPLDIAAALLVGVYALTVSRAGRTGRALGAARGAYGVLGLAYVGPLFGCLVLLRGLPGEIVVSPFGHAARGAWLALYVPACAWMTDTCAYLVGRSIGKHKLAPTLSPNKTIEGSIGGFTAAVVTGAAVGCWIGLPLLHGLAVGAIAGLVGQVGDLFKSSLKRELGIKDFGSAMPGHGGALDRFDSVLFVVPIVYLYLRVAAGY